MIQQWILAFRLKTLTAAFAPILVGTSLSMALGYKVSIWITFCALLASIFIQIGTNLINDAMDFKKGADNSKRIGPTRITQSGMANFKTVYRLGLLFFLLAVLFGVPLVLKGGLPILLIGLASLVCGYAYTGGPYPLAYHGLGDLFVLLFFGIMAVCGMTYIQINEWRMESLIAGIQLGALATILIAINNFRDIKGDRIVNKNTLAVRFGPKFVRSEIIILVCLTFLLNFYWLFNGFKVTAILSFISFPLAFSIARNILVHEPSPLFNRFLGQSALLQLLFGLLLSIGFYLH